jgi:hypothetical protein
LGGVGRFGVVACVQAVAVTPGELLADADLIHYPMGASESDEDEAIRKALDGFGANGAIWTHEEPAGFWSATRALTPGIENYFVL